MILLVTEHFQAIFDVTMQDCIMKKYSNNNNRKTRLERRCELDVGLDEDYNGSCKKLFESNHPKYIEALITRFSSEIESYVNDKQLSGFYNEDNAQVVLAYIILSYMLGETVYDSRIDYNNKKFSFPGVKYYNGIYEDAMPIIPILIQLRYLKKEGWFSGGRKNKSRKNKSRKNKSRKNYNCKKL